jgi:UDP-N-acetylmuramate dehydrogenase
VSSTERLDLHVQPNVPLAPFSTLGVGGAAHWFVRADTAAAVASADAWAAGQELPCFVLGGGSNIVVSDDGYRGVVLQIGMHGTTISVDAHAALVRAAAGDPWDSVVAATVSRGFAGLECLSGIPGSVGGTPIQNVGAYGQEVADAIESVTVFDRLERRVRTLTAADCGFAYRMSRFKALDAGRFVVCEVTFRLTSRVSHPTYPDVTRYLSAAGIGEPTVADTRAAVLSVRRGKGMVVDPGDTDSRSVGSFFMNPIVPAATRELVSSAAGEAAPAFALDVDQVKLPAAWLIERAGFQKGFADGAVRISTKHPLALVNSGGATARDVLRLASRIKRQVVDRFGVWLRPEPIFVGFENDPDVEYLQSTGPDEHSNALGRRL